VEHGSKIVRVKRTIRDITQSQVPPTPPEHPAPRTSGKHRECGCSPHDPYHASWRGENMQHARTQRRQRREAQSGQRTAPSPYATPAVNRCKSEADSAGGEDE